MPAEMRDDAVRSYYRMRQALGVLGLLLPLTLILGGFVAFGAVEPSISDYYHTLLRDVLVGTLSAIAIFLIFYRGHAPGPRDRVSDDLIATIGGVAALGVAYLPNTGRLPEAAEASVVQVVIGAQTAAIGHYVSATVFLSCLAWLSLVRFTRTAKPVRRRVYAACGWVIVAMTVATVVASWFKVMGPAGPQQVVNDWMLVLWFEAVAVWAFAVSWLTKGRADQALIGLIHLRRPAPRTADDTDDEETQAV